MWECLEAALTVAVCGQLSLVLGAPGATWGCGSLPNNVETFRKSAKLRKRPVAWSVDTAGSRAYSSELRVSKVDADASIQAVAPK